MTSIPTLPLRLAVVALAGALVAIEGGGWDDAWHTDRGRDSFFIAPHIALYSGVSLIGFALTLWVLLVVREQGIRAVLQVPALRLAVVALGFTLASAPVDNAWHEAFGRDAVIWSPPHMLGIAGTFALGAALLTQLRDHRAVFALGSGLMLAAAAFPVIEYETDVPQFSSLWYLPVLGVGASLAFGLVRLLDPRPAWAAARAAGAHLALFALLAAFLATQDFPAPALPLLLAPALASDAVSRRAAGPILRAAALTAGLYAAYVPVRDLAGNGVELTAADVALGIPITIVAVSIVEMLLAGRPPRRRLAGGAVAAAVLAFAPTALAHDPGQGDPAGQVALEITSRGDRVSVRGERAGCQALRGGSVVARREGVSRTAPLRVSGCRFAGDLAIAGRGRWFVYVEMLEGGRRVEAWLPVHVGGREVVVDRQRFAYRPREASAGIAKTVGGGAVYVLMLGLLTATVVLVRRSAAPPGRA